MGLTIKTPGGEVSVGRIPINDPAITASTKIGTISTKVGRGNNSTVTLTRLDVEHLRDALDALLARR